MFPRHARPKAGLDGGTLILVDEATEPEQLESAGDAETGHAPEEQPWWAAYGPTEEQAAEKIRHIDSLRGRQANELGDLRAQLAELRGLREEGAAEAGIGSPAEVAALLAEVDARALSHVEHGLTALASAVDERVSAVEQKLHAVVARMSRMGAPNA